MKTLEFSATLDLNNVSLCSKILLYYKILLSCANFRALNRTVCRQILSIFISPEDYYKNI